MSIKGIFLDFDGTLVDSTEAYLEAARTAFEAIGQEMVDIRIATELPKRLELSIPIDDLIRGEPHRFLEIYLKTYYKVTSTKTRPMPFISETLKALQQKAKLALVTMRHVSKQSVLDELRNFELEKYFSCVITALDTKQPKPSPEALLECGKRLNVKMSDSLVVGDATLDVRAGKSAGARTVAVLSGIFSFEELWMEEPDLILKNVSKLPRLI